MIDRIDVERMARQFIKDNREVEPGGAITQTDVCMVWDGDRPVEVGCTAEHVDDDTVIVTIGDYYDRIANEVFYGNGRKNVKRAYRWYTLQGCLS